jgi:succinate dehydrogenase/fumarate reductase flavoprotein subunit
MAYHQTHEHDVLIIGAGGAGLRAAIDWHTTGVTEAILSDNGTVQQVKATVPAGAAGHRFVHLRGTSPP